MFQFDKKRWKAAALSLAVVVCLFGQGKVNVIETGTRNASSATWIPPTCTFASPPGSPPTGAVCTFTDAASAGAVTGGGSALTLARYSGAAWVAVGASGSASAVGSAGALQASDGSGALADSGCTATSGVGSCTSFSATGSGSGGFAALVPNAGTTGTTAKYLAKIDSSGNAVKAGTSDTTIPVFITLATDSSLGCTAGTTGNACLVSAGQGTCTSDGSGITAGHYVINSTATAGRCADGGTTTPSVFSLGIAVTACAANADCVVQIIPLSPPATGATGATGPTGPTGPTGATGSNMIGRANFNGNGGISNAVYAGVISSVTRTGTGAYTVNFTGSQTDFSVSLTASNDSAAVTTVGVNGSPDFHAGVSSFGIVVTHFTGSPLTAPNADAQNITIVILK